MQIYIYIITHCLDLDLSFISKLATIQITTFYHHKKYCDSFWQIGRMDVNGKTKNVCTKQMEEKRSRGRPRQGRRDSMEKYFKELGITNSREKTGDRTEWRWKSSAAMNLTGSECS
jgi:hypothetical protein